MNERYVLSPAWLALVLTILVCGSGPASAGNLTFLKRAPIASFTDEDVRLMNETAIRGLDTSEPTTLSWTNPETGHSGTAQTSKQIPGPDGALCKRVRLQNTAGSSKSTTTYAACPMKDGGWRLVSNDSLRSKQPAK